MSLRIQRKKAAAVLVGSFLLLLFAKDFLGISMPNMVFTALWLLILVLADENSAAAFTLSSVICFASTLSITVPCAVYIVLSLFRRRTVKLDVFLLVSLYIVFVEAIRLLTVTGENFRSYVNSMAILFLVYTILSNLRDDRISAVKCIQYYIGFFVFLSLDIIWATVRSFGSFSAIISGHFRIGQVNTFDESLAGVFSINTNGIALMAIMAIASTVLLMSKKYISPKLAIPLLIYYSAVGFLTISKSFILVYAVFWCLYICWYFTKNHKNVIRPLCLISLFAILVALLWDTDVVQNVLARFDSEDWTTGRDQILVEYWNAMQESIFDSTFGVGLQNLKDKVSMRYAPHNAFLEIFVCFGGVGLAGYLLFFVQLIYTGLKICKAKNPGDRYRFINMIPFISYFIFIQGLQFLRVTYVYSLMAIAFAAFICAESQKKEEISA